MASPVASSRSTRRSRSKARSSKPRSKSNSRPSALKKNKTSASDGAVAGSVAVSSILSSPMTPVQELANAFSILVPALLAGYYRYIHQGHHFPTSLPRLLTSAPDIIYVSILFHNPFSFAYHLRCSLSHFPTDHLRIHNHSRRLDFALIHFCCATYAYALSGSVRYGLLLAALNAHAVWMLWRAEPSQAAGVPLQRRLQPLIQLYLAPILYRGDHVHFSLALFFGFVSLFLFMVSKKLNGWGHSLSHIVHSPLTLVLVSAAEEVDLVEGHDVEPLTKVVLVMTLARVVSFHYNNPEDRRKLAAKLRW